MQGEGNGPLEEIPKHPFAKARHAKEELKQAVLKELEPLIIPSLDFLVKILNFFRRLDNPKG